MNEYDFQPEEVDENPCIHELPQSLKNSRLFNNKCESFVYQLEENEDMSIPQSPLERIRSIKTPKGIDRGLQNQANHINELGSTKFNHFLQKQKAYQKKVQEKIGRLKQNIESKIVPDTFQPQINKKSKNYAKKINENVFQRLCKIQKKLQPHSGTFFHPQISQKSKKMQRNEPVQQFLYKDAKLRKERYESLKQMQKDEVKPQINSKSQELVGKKMLKEFRQVTEQMQLSLTSDEALTKQQFIQVFYQMGFVTPSIINYHQNLINNAYAQFCRAKPTCVNLFGFLLVLVGAYHIDPAELLDIQSNQSKPIFMVNQIQARSLHKKYNILYNNRLYQEQKSSGSLQNSFSFKPAISQQSEVLAEKHRKNLLAQASKLISRPEAQSQLSEPEMGDQRVKCQTITHPQFLILNKKMKELELEIKRQAEIKKIMEQCTFQPKVSKFEVTKRQKSVWSEVQGEHQGKQSIENSPMLILEIDFNGKEEQIVLRLQDEHILPNIAKYYSNKYFMDTQSETKLLLLLSSELKGFMQS